MVIFSEKAVIFSEITGDYVLFAGRHLRRNWRCACTSLDQSRLYLPVCSVVCHPSRQPAEAHPGGGQPRGGRQRRQRPAPPQREAAVLRIRRPLQVQRNAPGQLLKCGSQWQRNANNSASCHWHGNRAPVISSLVSIIMGRTLGWGPLGWDMADSGRTRAGEEVRDGGADPGRLPASLAAPPAGNVSVTSDVPPVE